MRVRKIVTHELLGSPAAESGWLSDWLDVDFLVVGTHGRRGPARLLLGSVASSVVKHARCPVLAERPKAHPESAKEPRIEPPCPACVEVRKASGGEQMWCARHSMHHPHAHVYSFSDHFGPESRPWGFHPEAPRGSSRAGAAARSSRPLRVAIVCSAHGLGHASRQIATARELASRGADVTFFSAAPAGLFEDELPGASVVPWQADVGIAQRDGVTEDPGRTLALLEELAGDEAIERLARALAPFDRVLVDVAPTALEAARRAGRRAIAVGNFDWAFIYRHYPELSALAGRFEDFQAPHEALELWPGPGMHGFSRVTPVGLLGRRAEPARVAPAGNRAVLLAFGGFGLRGIAGALPELPGVSWVLAPPLPRPERPDCVFVESIPFSSLLAGADAVFTKPGYGTFADCALSGVPMAWLDRGAFPEAPALEAAMRARGDRKISVLAAEAIADAVLPLLDAPRPPPLEAPAAARIADHVLA